MVNELTTVARVVRKAIIDGQPEQCALKMRLQRKAGRNRALLPKASATPMFCSVGVASTTGGQLPQEFVPLSPALRWSRAHAYFLFKLIGLDQSRELDPVICAEGSSLSWR